MRQGEYDEAKGSYVNMMDFRFATNVNTGETHSWFNTAFHLVKEFIAEGGYRLYPRPFYLFLLQPVVVATYHLLTVGRIWVGGIALPICRSTVTNTKFGHRFA